MDFRGVVGVALPEGEAVKITEKASGRVLWEKGTKYTFTVQANNEYGTDSKAFSIRVRE